MTKEIIIGVIVGAILAIGAQFLLYEQRITTLENKKADNDTVHDIDKQVQKLKDNKVASPDDIRPLSERVDDLNLNVSSISESINDIKLQINKVPIGGIILWWGDWNRKNSRPIGYELCDGSSVNTEDSPILGQRKPDMHGRYPKGAAKEHSNVLSNYLGGSDTIPQINTNETILTIDQIPAHTHGITDNGHSHIRKFGRMGHGDGGLIPGSRADAGFNDSYSNVSQKTGIKVNNTGGSKGHLHSIPAQKINPPYIELHFLMRVI